jgi:hypothetical protein
MMTTMRTTHLEGFDEIRFDREPIEGPGDQHGYRTFVAGPFVEVHARRGKFQISVYQHPASDARALVDEIRVLLGDLTGEVNP